MPVKLSAVTAAVFTVRKSGTLQIHTAGLSGDAATNSVVTDCTRQDNEIDSLNEEIQAAAGLVSRCINENASTEQLQDEYNEKYNTLVHRYEKPAGRLKTVAEERERRMQRSRELSVFIASLKNQPPVPEKWDEELWNTLPETAAVHRTGSITFKFKNGTEIEVDVG